MSSVTLPSTTTESSTIPDLPDAAAEMFSRIPQGEWTVEDFFELDQRTNRLIELVDGRVEFLGMPTFAHQDWVDWLKVELKAYCRLTSFGRVYSSPCPVQTLPTKWREPDLFVVTSKEWQGLEYAERGVSLALEVVSPDEKSRHRDLVTKRLEYAAAGIPEYWIVDPEPRTVTVLSLPAGRSQYAEHGVFGEGQTATSVVLAGFEADVSELFAAAE